ncbi:hypothetical protein BGZ58_001476, partial [Dissophora ornata]
MAIINFVLAVPVNKWTVYQALDVNKYPDLVTGISQDSWKAPIHPGDFGYLISRPLRIISGRLKVSGLNVQLCETTNLKVTVGNPVPAWNPMTSSRESYKT